VDAAGEDQLEEETDNSHENECVGKHRGAFVERFGVLFYVPVELPRHELTDHD